MDDGIKAGRAIYSQRKGTDRLSGKGIGSLQVAGELPAAGLAFQGAADEVA